MLTITQSLRPLVRSQPAALSRLAQRYLLSSKTSLESNSNKVQKIVASTENPCVAVLYQAIDPPMINGVRKLRKPGGIEPFDVEGWLA